MCRIARTLLLLVLFQANLFFPGSSGCLAAETASYTVEGLRNTFVRNYQCPLDAGLASFSARLTSEQVLYVAMMLKAPEPELILSYTTDGRVTTEKRAFPLGEEGRPLGEVTDAICSSAEGFFQAYETLALKNLLDDLPSSATVRMEGSQVIVEYPEARPGSSVKLVFDPDFRLALMEAEDRTRNGVMRMKPRWVRQNGLFILIALETETLINQQVTFRSIFRVENAPCGAFQMPSRVTIHAQDAEGAAQSGAMLDFQIRDYRLGMADPPGSEEKPR